MKKWVVPGVALLMSFAVGGQEPADSSGSTRFLEENGQLLETVEAIEAHLAARTTPAAVPAREPIHLNARRCVEMVIERNAQVLVSEARVAAALAGVGQARSQLFPQASVATTFSHSSLNTPEANRWMNVFQGFMGGGLGGSSGFGGGSSGFGGSSGGFGGGGFGGGISTGFPLIDIGGAIYSMGSGLGQSALMSVAMDRYFPTPQMVPHDDLRTDEISFTQVFYAGGQIRAAMRASKHLTESEEWQRDAVLAELEMAAKQTYYDALLAKALVYVAEDSVRTFERNLADAQNMFDVGEISRFEVLRAQTELGTRKATAVTASNGERLALAGLLRLLALPQDTPLALDAKLEWEPESVNVAEAVGYAMEHRPEIQALEKAVAAAEQNVRGVRGQFKPQVGGSIDYKNTHKGGPTMGDGWTFALRGEWEVYAGGRRKHETLQAKAELAQVEHELADLEALVELDVTQAHIQLEDAMVTIQSEHGTVDLAREGLRLAELRFKEGAGIQSEILDAELALTSAETSLVQAIRDYAVANALLERATGKNWSRAMSTAPEDE